MLYLLRSVPWELHLPVHWEHGSLLGTCLHIRGWAPLPLRPAQQQQVLALRHQPGGLRDDEHQQQGAGGQTLSGAKEDSRVQFPFSCQTPVESGPEVWTGRGGGSLRSWCSRLSPALSSWVYRSYPRSERPADEHGEGGGPSQRSSSLQSQPLQRYQVLPSPPLVRHLPAHPPGGQGVHQLDHEHRHCWRAHSADSRQEHLSLNISIELIFHQNHWVPKCRLILEALGCFLVANSHSGKSSNQSWHHFHFVYYLKQLYSPIGEFLILFSMRTFFMFSSLKKNFVIFYSIKTSPSYVNVMFL